MKKFDLFLKFLYKKQKIPRKSPMKFCEVYKDDAVKVRIVQQWFVRFRSRNFDAPRSGRSIVEKFYEIMEYIDQHCLIKYHGIVINIHCQMGLNHLNI